VIGIFVLLAGIALLFVIVGDNNTDTGSGGTPFPSASDCPRGTPEGFKLSDVEGKQLTEVETWAASKGMTVRVVKRDGQSLPVTMDFSPDRINTQVEAGVVTRYCGNY